MCFYIFKDILLLSFNLTPLRSNDFLIKKITLKNLNIQAKGKDGEQMRGGGEVTIKWQHKGVLGGEETVLS